MFLTACPAPAIFSEYVSEYLSSEGYFLEYVLEYLSSEGYFLEYVLEYVFGYADLAGGNRRVFV